MKPFSVPPDMGLCIIAGLGAESRPSPKEAPVPRGRRRRAPAPMTPERAADVRALCERLPWTWAKTYAERAPHWYVVRRTATFDDFQRLAEAIKTHGESWKFQLGARVAYYRYLRPGDGFKYWHMDNLINRATVSDDDPPQGHVDQPNLL